MKCRYTTNTPSTLQDISRDGEIYLRNIERVRINSPAYYFLSDKQKRESIKAEMDCSADLLSATGSCDFNLPTWWLPDHDGTTGGGSGVIENGDDRDMDTTGSGQDEPGSDCGETPGSEDDEGGDEGEGLEDYYSSDEDGDDRVLPPVGHLVFFVEDFALFVAAQLMGIRTTDEGIREVHLHWWSPSNKSVRDNASQYSIVEYGNHAFAADYPLAEETASVGKKRRRVADTDWEAANNVVVSCEKLRADKNIPKEVLDKLIVAHRTMSMHTSVEAD